MEGEDVNQNLSDGDNYVPMYIDRTKDIISDVNDNEALNGSDSEPLSLYLSESCDDSNFIFSDDDTKCNDRNEDNTRHVKVIVTSNLDPEPILDMNMNINSKQPCPDVMLEPIVPVSAEEIEPDEVEGEKTRVKGRAVESEVPSVVESVCYICGDSVLEGDDYQCHLEIFHNESTVLETGGTKEKDDVEDVSRESRAVLYQDPNINQSSNNQISVTVTAPPLKCYLCDLGRSRLSRSVPAELLHLHLEKTGRLGKGNPSEGKISNLASYLRVPSHVAQQVLEHLDVCKQTENRRSMLSFIRRMCWDNMDSLSDLSISFAHVWYIVKMLKDAHEISQEILGHVYTWKCMFRNDSYFKTFLREIAAHIHHGQDRDYTFTRNKVVEVVDLETESDITDPVMTRPGVTTAQSELEATPDLSSIAPPVSAHLSSRKKFKSSAAPSTNQIQKSRQFSNVDYTSSCSVSDIIYSTRQLSPAVPDNPIRYHDNSHYQHPALDQSGSPHRNVCTDPRPRHSLQTLAKALLDLGNQEGPKKEVQMNLTNGQTEGLRMLGIKEI